MEIKPTKLAFAAGLVMAIMYSAWTLSLKYWPREGLRATGKLIHLKGLIYLRSYLQIDSKTTLLGAIYIFLFIFAYIMLTVLIYRILVGPKRKRKTHQ